MGSGQYRPGAGCGVHRPVVGAASEESGNSLLGGDTTRHLWWQSGFDSAVAISNGWVGTTVGTDPPTVMVCSVLAEVRFANLVMGQQLLTSAFDDELARFEHIPVVRQTQRRLGILFHQ